MLMLLSAGLAIFIGLCGGLYLLQEQLIFLTRPLADVDRYAVGVLPGTTEVEVTAHDGTRLHGWLQHTAEETPSPGLVIYFGGNAEEVSGQMHDAPMLAPWSVAAFNYRGYGLSEGRPGEAALVADAIAIHDRLAARADVDPNRIVVLGRSLGSGVAVQLAANRPVRAVVLVSPFDSLRSLAGSSIRSSRSPCFSSIPSIRWRAHRGSRRPAGAGRRTRSAHPTRVLAAPARCLGRPEAMDAHSGGGSQRHPDQARLLAPDARVPRLPRSRVLRWRRRRRCDAGAGDRR